jgi:hypothetical protein
MNIKILILLLSFFTLPLSAQTSSPIAADQLGLKVQNQLTKLDGSSLKLTTTKRFPGRYAQIALTKRNKNGEVEWFNLFGGTSYEKAAAFDETPDGGYLILGSTSSFGAGNYDLWLVKTDAEGQQEWAKTLGDFYNEYGQAIQVQDNGQILIRATKQICTGERNNFSKCQDYPWLIETDAEGQVLKEQVLDQPIRR